MSQKAILQKIKQSLARQTMMGFLLYTFPGYQMGWVHAEICQKLDNFLLAVQNKKSPRLMIMMPPRSGKSEIISRRFPAYVFGQQPDMSIIGTSYSADLANRNNRDIQRTIDSNVYRELFPGVRLAGKNVRPITNSTYLRNSDIFEIIDHRGSYRSAGVGGGITGMGGDILLIDDPIKDRKEADSATIRNRIFDWFTSTLYTRLSPGGGIIIIQTRWHPDDLCGKLLQQAADNGEQWDVVEYPAIAEHDEPHRKQGEALHPARYPLEQLLRIKEAIGSRDWEALYQQRPTVDGGTIIQESWLRRYTSLPNHFETMVQSWDMSFKGTEDSDYVVGQVWGRVGANCYLVDQVRGRWGFTDTLEQFVKLTNKHPKATRKLVEDKANGPAVIDTLKNHVQGIVPVEPDGSKTARAFAVSAMFEAGNVWVPAQGMNHWITDYTGELLQFPVVAHDDQVDATTKALRFLQQKQRITINPSILPRRMW